MFPTSDSSDFAARPLEDPSLEFDHIGLIVPELPAGREFLAGALGISSWTPVVDDSGLRVSVQFGSAQFSSAQGSGFESSRPPLTYELIAPFGDASPIAGALRQGKSILNHVAYLTPDLARSAAHLRSMSCFPAGDPQPAVAYSGRLIQFWVSPLRFIIELIEKPGHRHAFAQPHSTPGNPPGRPRS